MFAQKDFEIDSVLRKPLMAHLSTVDRGAPRDSPVWFIWEEEAIWMFGTSEDSFVKRLRVEPRCAVGIVDFDLAGGVLRHVGIRGQATMAGVDKNRLLHFVAKYLGQHEKEWNPWFVANIVDPLDVMIKVTPTSVVAKDVSFFKTGPNRVGQGEQ